MSYSLALFGTANVDYLDFALTDPSTTFTTKLPLRFAALMRDAAWSLTRTGRGRGGQEGRRGDRFGGSVNWNRWAPHLAFATRSLLLGACSHLWFPTFAVSAAKHAGHTSNSAIQRLLSRSRYGVLLES